MEEHPQQQSASDGPPASSTSEQSAGDRSSLPSTAAELPPVEPPSAGFIVQLFVVPALIVMLVVGIWIAFGKLASSKQDLQVLVAELRSGNPQREQRAALELAQLIRADLELGEDGEQLAENEDLAQALARLLEESLQEKAPEKEQLQQQAFLSRTLGFLDVPDQTCPVLVTAMQSRDVDIRKTAMASLANICDRQHQAGEAIDSTVTEAMIEASKDEDVSVRQIAAYSLGVIPGPESEQRLQVLLANSDDMTAINAALGLARQGSKAGLQLFLKALEEAGEPFDAAQLDQLEAEERAQRFELKMRTEPLVLKNTFRAITDLMPKLTAEDRAQVLKHLGPVADGYHNMAIQIDARKLRLELEKEPEA